MKAYPQPLDLRKIKVFPLAQRDSLSATINSAHARPHEPDPSRCFGAFGGAQFVDKAKPTRSQAQTMRDDNVRL